MRRAHLLTAIGLAAITCVYTWPLPVLAGSAVAHDRGDPLLVTWILWWTSHTIPLSTAWWNAPAFYPSTGVLAYSENLLSLAPITAPIIWVTQSPLLAYNTAFLLSYVFCGLGAYGLALVVTGRRDASLVAAIAFAFAPYRLSHTQHLQLLSSYWMPVSVAALHLYLRAPRWRWAVLFVAAWVLQALASGYYLFFLTAFVGLWMAWFMPGRLSVRDTVRLGGTWVAGAILLAPLLLGYRSIHASYGFRRSQVEVVNYSADVLGLFAVSPDSLLWSWLHAPVSAESEEFPGLTILLILLLVPWVRKWEGSLPSSPKWGPSRFSALLGFYVGAAVVLWTLSLGPVPKMAGTTIVAHGPYALLAILPGFEGIRVPARLWMVATLCLAVAAALVIARIESARTRRIVILVSVAGLLLDGWPRAFPIVAAPGMRITSSSARVRLGLPLHEAETETMYGAIAQGKPVFNGYSGYVAPQHAALRDLLEHHDPRILPRLAANEPIEIVVESAGDPDGSWNAFVQRQPGATRADAGSDWTSYMIPATGAVPAQLPSAALSALHIARITTSHNAPDINAVLDGDLVTRWHSQPQTGQELITIELDRPQHVAAVVLYLGTYAAQYPRRLEIAVSPSGAQWSTVYTGDTALETYDAALRSPREIPITLPVARDDVRYIRLRQTGSDAKAGWTIVELRVLG